MNRLDKIVKYIHNNWIGLVAIYHAADWLIDDILTYFLGKHVLFFPTLIDLVQQGAGSGKCDSVLGAIVAIFTGGC